MAQKAFANSGTTVKLETVFEYANFYTSALKFKPSPSNPFRLSYLDAFAGTGDMPFASEMPLLEEVVEVEPFISGSARRALQVSNPFANYVFADSKQKNTTELEKLKLEFSSLAERIHVSREDANEVVKRFCTALGSRDRALVFLDPFGNQVKWETLEILAATGKVDLWYLFPAWIGVARQIKGTGEVLSDAEKSIDAMFGPHDWRTECLKPTEPKQSDFFAEARPEKEKNATADGITRYMIRCMETIFRGGVSNKWLPLGRNGRHYYSLLFACANPSDNAHKLAQRVAREIMTRK